MKKLLAVFLALLLLAVVATGVAAQSGGAGWYDFDTGVRVWQELRVYGDIQARDDMTVTDALVVGGGTNFTGNMDVTGNLEVVDHIANSGQMYFITGDAVTVSNGGTVTPTEALVELTSAGTVGTSLGTCSDGQYVMFMNSANQTITITDTGTTRLASDWAGGQYDTLTLACVGVAWYEIARSVN